MSKTLDNYISGIVAGNPKKVAATMSSSLVMMPPASETAVESKEQASLMLGSAAKAIQNLKWIRTFEASKGYTAVVFQGFIEDTSIELIDLVHQGDDHLVDHIDVLLRPASISNILLQRMAEAVKSNETAA